MSLHLYQIADNMRAVLDAVNEDTGEIDAAALDAVQLAFDAKAEAVAQYVRELLAEAEGIKSEADRLAKKASAAKNHADSLKQYLLNSMTAAHVEKVKGKVLSVAVREAQPALHITAEAAIPRTFYVTPEPELNRAALKDALKEGQEVPGAELTRSKFLTIR